MSGTVFLYLVLSIFVLCIGAPMWVAARRQALFGSDFALVLAPVPLCILAMVIFNDRALTGWSWILYSILLQILAVTLLNLRVFLSPKFGWSAKGASIRGLLAMILLAVGGGAFIPQLLE